MLGMMRDGHISSQAAPNNGMHPTRISIPVMQEIH
jgi:hypothetical protein